jgi:thioredoxin 1
MPEVIKILFPAFILLRFFAGCGEAGNSNAEVASEVSSIIDSTLSSGIDSAALGVPSLVDLGSTSCTPCQMMAGELERLDTATGDELLVTIIDVNQDQGASEEYGIRLIPTQIFLSETGTELYRHEGYFSFDDMIAKWQELGYTFDVAVQE